MMLPENPIGEPDAGNPPVRFDEGAVETGLAPRHRSTLRRAWWWMRHPEDLPSGVEYRPPTESFARGDAVHLRIETVDAAPVVASRAPYAAALLAAVGIALALALWLGWL